MGMTENKTNVCACAELTRRCRLDASSLKRVVSTVYAGTFWMVVGAFLDGKSLVSLGLISSLRSWHLIPWMCCRKHVADELSFCEQDLADRKEPRCWRDSLAGPRNFKNSHCRVSSACAASLSHSSVGGDVITDS